MKREMICIICPRGCTLCADMGPGHITVTGNACPRGEKYAINECVNPVRTVTATVRVTNRDHTMVSVKTSVPVPKEKMLDVVKALRNTGVEAPVSIGDVILRDICGSDIVATKTVC